MQIASGGCNLHLVRRGATICSGGEGVQAKDLAYDRPSAKMLPFLAKHFGLHDFIEQPNRFVIFNESALLSTK